MNSEFGIRNSEWRLALPVWWSSGFGIQNSKFKIQNFASGDDE